MMPRTLMCTTPPLCPNKFRKCVGVSGGGTLQNHFLPVIGSVGSDSDRLIGSGVLRCGRYSSRLRTYVTSHYVVPDYVYVASC